MLQRKPLPQPGEEHRVPAISEALKREGEELLNFTPKVQQWQLRVLSLRKWRPTEGWPDVSTRTLLLTNCEWLLPHLQDVELPDDLLEIDLLPILQQQLTSEPQVRLEELAPQVLQLPDGSFADLEYQPAGAPPQLRIRLQEVLGWQHHPHIDAGEMTIELHLLSPDGHPVAVTTDLHSFWELEYPMLREQLRLVFPQVEW